MATYLFAWNPDKWGWDYFEKQLNQLQKAGSITEWWNCASHKKIKVGDRAFLVKLGKQMPRGIMGSGRIVKEPFLEKHYDKNRVDKIHRIVIEFDALLDYREDLILPMEILKNSVSSVYKWTPQGSGVSIPEAIAQKLENVWDDYLNGQNQIDLIVGDESVYLEGAARQFTVTKYERDGKARMACISHYGASCAVCDFNFQITYGEIGKNFIHVHHLVPLSTIRTTYIVDPIRDLRPVCPNCHAMIHSKKDFYSISELRTLLDKGRKG